MPSPERRGPVAQGNRAKDSPLAIGGVAVSPGQRLTINLPLARLHTFTEMTIPLQVIAGKRPGPRLFVSAAIHGDEINGVEIIQRLLKLKLLRNLKGTLIVIPVVNVFGFIDKSRYLPDGRDLNRSFPGFEKGSLAARLAHLLMEEVISKCSHGIDLHTATNHRRNLPQIRAWLDDAETERLAHAFGVPVIINANLRDGSLRQAAVETGIPMLVYEGGEALRFNEVAIRAGLSGVLSVMRSLGMVSGKAVSARVSSKKQPETLIARHTTWMRAPEGGILHSTTHLGSRVAEGEVLGVITDPFGENEVPVLATTSGIVIGRLNLPLVNEGEALFHLARFDSPTSIDAALESFSNEFAPNQTPDFSDN